MKNKKRILTPRERVIVECNTLFSNIVISAIQNYNINSGDIHQDIKIAISGKY